MVLITIRRKNIGYNFFFKQYVTVEVVNIIRACVGQFCDFVNRVA